MKKELGMVMAQHHNQNVVVRLGQEVAEAFVNGNIVIIDAKEELEKLFFWIFEQKPGIKEVDRNELCKICHKEMEYEVVPFKKEEL